MKNSQSKQFLVKLKDEKEGEAFIHYLEQKGFQNKHAVSYENLRVKVLVVEDKSFWATNITCLAAAASCGIKAISVEDYKLQQSKTKKELSSSRAL